MKMIYISQGLKTIVEKNDETDSICMYVNSYTTNMQLKAIYVII